MAICTAVSMALLLAAPQARTKTKPPASPPLEDALKGGGEVPVAKPEDQPKSVVNAYYEWLKKAADVHKAGQATCASPASEAARTWCETYWAGTTSKRFDLAPFAPADAKQTPAVLAGYAAHARALENAVSELRKVAPPEKIAPTLNAAAPAPIGVSLLAGNFTEALTPVLGGLEAFIEQRVQEEGVIYVLGEIEDALCKDQPGVDDPDLPRFWVPHLCALADASGLGGPASSGGLATISTLKKALEQDFRQAPGAAAFAALLLPTRQLAAKPDDAGLKAWAPVAKAAAQPTRNLSDNLMNGIDLYRALDKYAKEVAAAADKDSAVKALYALSCPVSLPPGLRTWSRQIDAVLKGSTPAGDDRKIALAALLLTDQPCLGLFEYRGTMKSSDREYLALRRMALDGETFRKIADALDAIRDDLEKLEAGANAVRAEAEQKSADAAGAKLGALLAQGTRVLGDVGDGLAALGDALGCDGETASTAQAACPVLAKTKGAESSVLNMARMTLAAVEGDLTGAWTRLLAHVPGKGTSLCSELPCIAISADAARYGGMLVAIASAKTADDVTVALKNAAAPVGSWRQKFDSRAGGMLSIDGAFGLGAFPSYNHDGSYGHRSPLTVPLGVDWNVTSFCSGRFNIGLLFQILDLGGYSQLRFAPDGSTSSPRLLQALSPGVNLRLGLFRSPLTFNVGVAYDFDEGEPAGPSGHVPDGYHFNVFVAVDSTLFVLKAY